MKCRRFRDFFLAGALSLLASQAAATYYECDLESNSRLGWISPKLFLLVSDDQANAEVYDYYIDKTFGKPISARVSRLSAKKLKFSWEVPDAAPDDSNFSVTLMVSTTLHLQSHKMRMLVWLRGYPMEPTGSGTCKIVKPGRRKK